MNKVFRPKQDRFIWVLLLGLGAALPIVWWIRFETTATTLALVTLVAAVFSVPRPLFGGLSRYEVRPDSLLVALGPLKLSYPWASVTRVRSYLEAGPEVPGLRGRIRWWPGLLNLSPTTTGGLVIERKAPGTKRVEYLIIDPADAPAFLAAAREAAPNAEIGSLEPQKPQ